VRATVGQRPSYIAEDLRSLYVRADSLRVGPHPAWYVDVGPSVVTVQSTGRDPGDPLSVVRATASAVWNAELDGQRVVLMAGDDTARQAMDRWSLLSPPNRLA
jgi:glycerol-1-phosphatase